MDGGGLRAAQLPQPLCGPARRRGQRRLQAQRLKQGQHPPQRGGFTGARPAGEQHDLTAGRQPDGLPLLLGVGDVMLLLDAVDELVQRRRGAQLHRAHFPHPPGNEALRLVQLRDVHRLYTGDVLPDHLAPAAQAVQADFQSVGALVQQPGRRVDQLVPGHEAVSVVIAVVVQLKEKPGLQSLGVPWVQAQRQGGLVRQGEVHAELLAGQYIGVAPDQVQRRVPVVPDQGDRQLHGELVPGQKIHQAAHPHLLAEAGADLLGALGGDALDLDQLFRVLQSVQGVFAELLQQPPCGGLAHALHPAAGQIVVHFLHVLGQAALHRQGLELGAVGGVPGPASVQDEIFPRRDAGHGAHGGDLLVFQLQAQNRIAVFLVLKDESGHDPLYGLLFHLGHASLLCILRGILN